MAWRKGQPWRVVRSLDTLNRQIRAAYPRAVPPATPVTSWGALADDEHSTSSDHYPHYYGALGSTAVVCARDFPHAPRLGLDAHALAERLRLSRDPRIGYIISNGRETGPRHNWKWDDYDGSDPHDTHIHVSTVHTAAADNAKDWQIREDDDMSERSDQILASFASGKLDIEPSKWQVKAEAHQARVELALSKLLDQDPVDEAQIVAGLLGVLTPQAIAAAIPDALAVEVADELAARLQRTAS